MAHQKRRLGCDPPHDPASLSAVLAHAHECAARAPRHRDRLARRLTTDPPFLFMLGWRLARWRLAVCGACSRTRVRSASSSPPTHHRTTARNRSAASGHGCWRLANCRALAASLSAVPAHAHECAPRAPRHRDAIARAPRNRSAISVSRVKPAGACALRRTSLLCRLARVPSMRAIVVRRDCFRAVRHVVLSNALTGYPLRSDRSGSRSMIDSACAAVMSTRTFSRLPPSQSDPSFAPS